MDNVPKETHVVSVTTFLSLETVAVVRDEKDDRHLLHPTRRENRLTARDKNPHRNQAINRKTRKTRLKFHADSNSVKIRHVDSGILPCVRISSLKKVVYMVTHAISEHVEAEGKSSKKSKKDGAKGPVALLKESTQLGCVSQNSYPRKCIPREKERWDQNTPSNSPKAPGTK